MPERPLRICLLIGRYAPLFSGQAIQIQRCLPYLLARDIEVTVLTRRLARSSGIPPREEFGTIDRVLAPGQDPLSTLWRVMQFRRYMARRMRFFDVFHCNMLAWEFLLNARYLESLGLPILVEMVLLGGDDPLTVSRERFGSFKMGLLTPVKLWTGLAQAFLPRLPAAGISTDRFRLVYPGVNLDAYRPLDPEARRAVRSRLGLPPDARIVISVGSIIRRKGIDRTLEAWAHLPPQAGRDLLLLVGPSEPADGWTGADRAFALKAKERAAASDLEGTVRFVGRAGNVNEYLGAADLFLFLSRQEGLGIVMLEALACGLPCVVSPLDGIAAEIVSDGQTGVIVKDPDDAAAVAASVRRLIDRTPVRAAMEASARAAASRFSFEARADALASIYRSLAAVPSRAEAVG